MRKYYVVICDLDDKYESDIQRVGEIQRHHDNRIDVAIEIAKHMMMINHNKDNMFEFIIDVDWLIRIPSGDFGNVHIY